MRPDYRDWLEQQRYQSATVSAQLHRARRVEEFYGDLDEHYSRDHMEGLIEALKYSTEDQRRNRPNPSKIPFRR